MWSRGALSLAVLVLAPTLAPTAVADAAVAGSRSAGPQIAAVRFRNYSTQDGMSQATAMTLAQGKTGFIWVGTQDGLDRFDGYGFRVYRHDRADPYSLADNAITAIVAAPDASLWVGTQAGGLDHYDPALDRFEHHRADASQPNALAANHVTALLVDHRGWLWVATTAGKLQWLDPHDPDFHDTPLGVRRELADVRALVEQGDGSVLIGTRNGLWRCDSNASHMQELRYDDDETLDVQAITLGDNGDIWVSSTDQGLYRFSGSAKPLAHYYRGASGGYALPGNQTRGLEFDRSGRLWVATKASGLLCLDPRSPQVLQYRHHAVEPQSLAADRVRSVLVDRDGLIWAGTWNNGLSVHDPRTEAFASIRWIDNKLQQSPSQPVVALYADSDDSLWMSLPEAKELVHISLKSGVIASFSHHADAPGSLPENLIEDIVGTRDGSLWLATTGAGLQRLPPGASKFVAYRHDPDDPDSLASDDLLYAMQDRNGTLWVGTVDAGLDELCEGCRRFRHHRHDPARADSIGPGPIDTILEARDGTLWVALRPGGLDRYDRAHDRFTHFVTHADDPQSLSNDTVTTLMQDRRGGLWIGTQGGGLNHLAPEDFAKPRFETVSTANGLAADAIGSIVEDARGQLWLSTTAGISRYDPVRHHVVNFGTSEGALPRGYYINVYAVLSDGRIVFGGLSGATLFDPAAVRLPPSPHPIITEVLLNNQQVAPYWRNPDSPIRVSPWSPNSLVQLNYRQDNVSFQFSALGFADPESIEYSYRLEGHDTEWIHAGASRRYATYTDLSSGDYRLRVRARRDGDSWNTTEAHLNVRVLPVPWLSPQAILLYCAGLVLVFGFAGSRLRANLRRESQAREAIRLSEERLKYALWGSGGELWDVDLLTGEILRENRLEHLAATRQTKSQTLGEYRQFVHVDDLPGLESELRAHLKGEQDFLEVSYRSPDVNGEWRWLLSRGRVVGRDAEGRARRLVGTTQDITRLKRAEESLRHLNEELESRVDARTAELRKTNAELRRTLEQLTLAQRQLLESEKMAALGGLVAGVAHEINTPLGVTVTAASHLQEETARLARLAADDALTPPVLKQFQSVATQSAEIILRNLKRADTLIRSFKLVAVDQTTEERRVIDLGAYLNEILTSLRPVLKKSPHQVEIDCPQQISWFTFPGAIYQIVSNLIMNSLTHGFSPDRPGRIVISARLDGQLVALQYHDNGSGMSPDIRSRIFEPFFTTRRGQGGSGLGMHIVYNLVTQLLHGSIRVQSTPGEGTTFELFMPLDPGVILS